jgi:hypothetical protein
MFNLGALFHESRAAKNATDQFFATVVIAGGGVSPHRRPPRSLARLAHLGVARPLSPRPLAPMFARPQPAALGWR